MCKESNEDDTKERHYRTNKQTKGTRESSVGVLVRVHMLQVCVQVRHVVVLVVLLRVINSVVISVPTYSLFTYTAETGLLRCLSLHLPSVTVDRPSAVNDLSSSK